MKGNNRRSIKYECFNEIGFAVRNGNDEDYIELKAVYHNVILNKTRGVSILGNVLSEN
jgi:hypothetical protein